MQMYLRYRGRGVNYSSIQVTTSLSPTYYTPVRWPFVWFLKPLNLTMIRRCSLLSRAVVLELIVCETPSEQSRTNEQLLSELAVYITSLWHNFLKQKS